MAETGEPMDPMLERLGAAVRERYRIERELGRGGMAAVFLAADLRHHRQVALDPGKDQDTLAAVRLVGASTATLDEWTDVHEYLVAIVRKFRGELWPLRRYAQDISGPFEAEALAPFVRWHVDSTRRGRMLRCVFEDSATFHSLLKELHLRNMEEKILGEHYREDSIVVEPDTGHFDLIEPSLVERNIDALVANLRGKGPRKA